MSDTQNRFGIQSKNQIDTRSIQSNQTDKQFVGSRTKNWMKIVTCDAALGSLAFRSVQPQSPTLTAWQETQRHKSRCRFACHFSSQSSRLRTTDKQFPKISQIALYIYWGNGSTVSSRIVTTSEPGRIGHYRCHCVRETWSVTEGHYWLQTKLVTIW